MTGGGGGFSVRGRILAWVLRMRVPARETVPEELARPDLDRALGNDTAVREIETRHNSRLPAGDPTIGGQRRGMDNIGGSVIGNRARVPRWPSPAY